MVADGTGVGFRVFGGGQPDAALGAGELHQLGIALAGQNLLPAHRAADFLPVRGVVHKGVAAVWADPAGQAVGADIDGVAAVAVDFPAGKEAGLGLGIAPAVGAFDYKFGHFFHLHVGIFYGLLCSMVVVPLLIIYYSTFRLIGNSLIQSLSFSADSKICLKKSILFVA